MSLTREELQFVSSTLANKNGEARTIQSLCELLFRLDGENRALRDMLTSLTNNRQGV